MIEIHIKLLHALTLLAVRWVCKNLSVKITKIEDLLTFGDAGFQQASTENRSVNRNYDYVWVLLTQLNRMVRSRAASKPLAAEVVGSGRFC